MKKLISLSLTVCMCLSIGVGLTACDEEHTHTLTKTDAVSATCEVAGNSEYYSCDCGKYFSDADGATEIAKDSWIVAAKGHTLTKTDAVSATCEVAGNSEYYSCDCGKYFSDADGATEIVKDSWIVSATGHSWGEGSITTPATPNVDGVITYTCGCGETKTETYTYTSLATVTEEEWNQAFADAMSKTVAKTITKKENENVVLTAMLDGESYSFLSGSYGAILTTSNGNYVCYEKNDDVWSLNTAIATEETYNDNLDYLYSMNIFGYFRTNDFETATFNETDGTYTYSAVFSGSTTLEYVATFMQGKLTSWTITALNTTLTFDFAEPTIEIPQV